MKVDIEKIQNLYGESIIIEMKDNFGNVIDNLSYLKKNKIINYDEILENYPYLFILSPISFQKKTNQLLTKLGNHYNEILEKNISLWGEIL